MNNKIQGIALLLVYIVVGSALLNDAFVSPFNMQNIVRYCSLFGIIGIGVAFVIITGGIDLSIGSVIGLSGCVFAILLTKLGWSIPATLLTVMLLSVLLGLVHGLLITKLGLQPFIVTLCGLLIYRGVARWITSDQTHGFGSTYDDTLRKLANGKPCSVAMVLAALGAGILIVGFWRMLKDRGTSQRLWVAISTLVVGLMLLAVGGSRFSQGYTIEKGNAFASFGGQDWRSWGAIVPDAAAQRPIEMMNFIGKFTFVPLFAAMAFLLILSERGRAIGPIVLTLVGFVLVYFAKQLTIWPADAFWGGEAWADRFRMLAVFGTLAVLIGGASWLLQTAARSSHRLVPGLLNLVMAVAILWLIGKTPLGKTVLPAPFFMLVVLGVAAAVFLNCTIYGRYLLALGNNREAALYSGINTDRMTILAYVICAAAAGVFGILFSLDNNTIQPANHGNFYELYAIAAAVLGGCSLRGGEGSILGVVIGAAVMRVLYNSINLLGIPSQLEFAIIGFVILLGAIADEIVRAITERRILNQRVADGVPTDAKP